MEDFEPKGCVDAAQIIVDFMTSYDISAHEALLIERPVEEVDLKYFDKPLFIFKFSKGALPEYNLTESYSKLLENGVTGEYVCVFENNQGKSYSINQIMCAAPQIDVSDYKKVVLNEWTFGIYYIDSDETKTTLVCKNGSFLLKIEGLISEDEAVSVFLNMREEYFLSYEIRKKLWTYQYGINMDYLENAE